MANQSIIIGGKTVPLANPKSGCSIASRQPGGKYHKPNTNWWTGGELNLFASLRPGSGG